MFPDYLGPFSKTSMGSRSTAPDRAPGGSDQKTLDDGPASPAFRSLAPMMIGARDVAFPRLNLLSWYVYITGGLFTLAVTIAGGAG
jgi:hypothetical protein